MHNEYSVMELFEELKQDKDFDPNCEYKEMILDDLLISILQ